jgi:EAL domain
VGRGLHRHGLLPGELMLEINEAVLAGGPAHTAAALAALAALGVPLSIDDFGTGHSSLARLTRLPVSEIKIDASFITRLLGDPDNELILKSLVELVRALGLKSVAEGWSHRTWREPWPRWAVTPRRGATTAARWTRLPPPHGSPTTCGPPPPGGRGTAARTRRGRGSRAAGGGLRRCRPPVRSTGSTRVRPAGH